MMEAEAGPDPEGDGPYTIVVGNAKGGTGKSTTAMHLIVALLRLGYRVGSIDLDGRQGTLTRYLTNRENYARDAATPPRLPVHVCICPSDATDRAAVEADEQARFDAALKQLADCDFIVIDTPGSDSHLARLGHLTADTLITPINDSFIDIDVLAHIDREKRQVLAPSSYTQMVWEQYNRRIANGQTPIDWIVLRNRLAHIEARNMRDIGRLMEQLAKRLGFRLAPGFGERVVFRELFLNGLTLLDLPTDDTTAEQNRSHVSGRQEVQDLLQAIGLPTALGVAAG